MNQTAPEGFVYVCTACGKRSMDRYGDKAISDGWDESCMLHCALFAESSLVLSGEHRGARVIDIRDQKA